jgi:ABC-type Fe3+-hydroxamate transport system substrate-binding protein
LVDTFLRFGQNSFEEQQAATVLAAFQKSFAQIREKYEPIGRKRLKSKTE